MRKITASSFKLLSDAHGAIAIQVAVALPVLIGFTALGIEMTTLFVQQKRMQSAADAAVVAAGSTGLTTAQSLAAARAIAGANGFVNGTNGTVVTLNTPPTGGTNISTQSAREIIISRPMASDKALATPSVKPPRAFAGSAIPARPSARKASGCCSTAGSCAVPWAKAACGKPPRSARATAPHPSASGRSAGSSIGRTGSRRRRQGCRSPP